MASIGEIVLRLAGYLLPVSARVVPLAARLRLAATTSSSTSPAETVVIIVITAALIIAAIRSVRVGMRSRLTVRSRRDSADTRRAVSEVFSNGWARVPGDGDDNFEQLPGRAVVMSVSYRPSPGGGTEVDAWCSRAHGKYSPDASWLIRRMKRAVTQAVQALPRDGRPRPVPAKGETMGIFGRQQDAPRMTAPPYQPIVDMRTARPAVFTLAHAMALNDAEVRAAIVNLARLSGRPRLEQVLLTMRTDPDVPDRPWIWLAAVMRQAGESGDHALAVAALFWSFYWTTTLVPRIGDTWMAFVEQDINLDPIPPALKKEILALGLASASQLPDDLVIAGDATDAMRVGWIAEAAETLLAP